MLFFNPSAYEEMVYKLASLRVRPPDDVWLAIMEKQIFARNMRRRLLVKRLSVAATVVALIGLSVISFQLSVVNPYLSSSTESSLASLDNTLLPILTDPFTRPVVSNTNIQENRSIIKLTDQDEITNDLNEEKIDPTQELKRIAHSEKVQVLTLNNTKSRLINFSDQTDKLTIAESNSKTLHKNRWTIYASFAPSYSYHTQGLSNFSYYSNEQGAWLWTGEVIAKRRINKRMSVHSGLTLSPSGQTIGNIILLTSSKVNTNMEVLMASTAFGRVSLDNQIFGVINTENVSSTPNTIVKNSAIDKAKLSQRLYYLEVPLMFSYSLFDKSSEFEFKFGGSAGFLIINQFVLKGNEKKFFGKTEGVNPFNASLVAGICFTNAINKKLHLHIEPSFRLGTNPLNYNEMKTFPFSSSIKVGLSYNLH